MRVSLSDCFQVDESMENVEYVVRERNRAYFELETGVSGEAERRIQTGPFGLPVGYTPKVKSPENRGGHSLEQQNKCVFNRPTIIASVVLDGVLCPYMKS